MKKKKQIIEWQIDIDETKLKKGEVAILRFSKDEKKYLGCAIAKTKKVKNKRDCIYCNRK